MEIETKSGIAALATLLGLTGCATDTWSRTDTLGELTVAAVLATDAYQTAQFRNHPTQYESGWVAGICGSRPSSACSYEYFGTVALSHWVISKLMPGWMRPYWQVSVGVVETSAVIHNASLRP